MSNPEQLQQSLKSIRNQLEVLERRLESQPGPGRALPRGEPAGGLDLGEINRILRRLTAAATRQGILAVYLEAATSMAERGILFTQTDGRLVPWKAVGFEVAGLPTLRLDQHESLLVQSAIQKEIVIAGRSPERDFPWAAGAAGTDRQACCLPLILGDSVPLILYVDGRRELPLDSLELLTQLALLVLKNHELRTRLASRGEERRPGSASRVGELVHPAGAEG